MRTSRSDRFANFIVFLSRAEHLLTPNTAVATPGRHEEAIRMADGPTDQMKDGKPEDDQPKYGRLLVEVLPSLVAIAAEDGGQISTKVVLALVLILVVKTLS